MGIKRREPQRGSRGESPCQAGPIPAQRIAEK
ncbi:hypothetical protein [Clostridium phage Saumur]|nr:hypothetical protein [Clostridium phage Saumur]